MVAISVEPMIDFTTPQPLSEAVASLSKRTPLGSKMTSAEWERAPADVRDAAFFSATVEEERILASMQAKLLQRVRLARSKDAAGVTMDRSRFIAEMQDELKAAGYRPDPKKRGGIQDVSSAGRLGLIWDMMLAMSQGYAEWKSGMDADILEAFPARELVRLEARVEHRLWPEIWAKNGGTFYGGVGSNPDYPAAPGRMIALATDEIWTKISRFQKPWPPFDWGSGMGLRKVRSRDAAAVGLVEPVKPPEDPKPAPAQPVKPLDVPLSTGMKASLKGIPAPSVDRLRSTFGDSVTIAAEEITLTRKPVKESIPAEIQRRSKAVAKALEAITEEAEVAASISAVAVGRRAMASFVNVPAIKPLPAGTEAITIDGVTHVWRPDLTGLDAAAVTALPDGGKALLNGLAVPGDRTAVELVISGPNGKTVKLRVPRAGAAVWAQSRLKDFSLAFGSGWKATLDGKAVTL
jgi:hypothetical protein